MNLIIRYLGYILLISSLFRIIPITVALIYHESTLTFALSFLISMALGLALLYFEKNHNAAGSTYSLEQLNLPNAMVLTGLSFLVLPAIGAVSFLPSFNYNFLNAFFESISGFTTTGLTLYSSLQGLPQSLLMWRSVTQWMGGIGILLVFLFIISHLKFRGKEENTQIEATSSLYSAQGFAEKLEPNLNRSSKNILIIYGSYTLIGVALLYVSGMDLFESMALSFSSISTGGFIVTDSLQATNLQLGILCLLMILGSISFITHNQLLKKRFKEFFGSLETKISIWLMVVFSGLALFVFDDHKIILFEIISAFTTSGYSITDISVLPHLFILLIMAGMVIGGSISSTSGGLKVSRVYSLLKMIPWMIKKISSPRHAIIPFRIKNKIVEEDDLIIIVVFVTLFLSFLFVGTVIFLILGYGMLGSSFQMASALGTVGLQTMDLLSVPVIGKVVLILAMLLGRLEIFPLLIILRKMVKHIPLFKGGIN